MISNVSSAYIQISDLLEAISSPVRIQILLAIGVNEVCVCHLENLLGLRQAYISQQLMALREKEIITARREGKYIYYRLAKPETLQIVQLASQSVGVVDASQNISMELLPVVAAPCECPKCKEEV